MGGGQQRLRCAEHAGKIEPLQGLDRPLGEATRFGETAGLLVLEGEHVGPEPKSVGRSRVDAFIGEGRRFSEVAVEDRHEVFVEIEQDIGARHCGPGRGHHRPSRGDRATCVGQTAAERLHHRGGDEGSEYRLIAGASRRECWRLERSAGHRSPLHSLGLKSHGVAACRERSVECPHRPHRVAHPNGQMSGERSTGSADEHRVVGVTNDGFEPLDCRGVVAPP